jgi:hypothetical protein
MTDARDLILKAAALIAELNAKNRGGNFLK